MIQAQGKKWLDLEDLNADVNFPTPEIRPLIVVIVRANAEDNVAQFCCT